jgi:hypothetical protein
MDAVSANLAHRRSAACRRAKFDETGQQVAERRYLSEGSMAKLTQTGDDPAQPKEVRKATAALVAP